MNSNHPGFNDVAHELARERGISVKKAKTVLLASRSGLPPSTYPQTQMAESQSRPQNQEAR